MFDFNAFANEDEPELVAIAAKADAREANARSENIKAIATDANNGNAEAQYTLAVYYIDNNSMALASHWLRQAANNGHEKSAAILAKWQNNPSNAESSPDITPPTSTPLIVSPPSPTSSTLPLPAQPPTANNQRKKTGCPVS